MDDGYFPAGIGTDATERGEVADGAEDEQPATDTTTALSTIWLTTTTELRLGTSRSV